MAANATNSVLRSSKDSCVLLVVFSREGNSKICQDCVFNCENGWWTLLCSRAGIERLFYVERSETRKVPAAVVEIPAKK